ncbi:MAG: hypothetical protein IKL48_00145 [Elusimicrobiaceae bacterium]|nr:hypothetical protein [Elusimicrobiaceae bacterium]
MGEKKNINVFDYGRPFWAVIGDDNAANVAGASQIVADLLFGPKGMDAQNSFERGKKEFKDELRRVRFESPFTSLGAEMAGEAAFGALGGAVGKANMARQGSLWHLFNKANSYVGARQLERALRRGVFDKDIFAGRFSRKRMNEINQVRQEKNYKPLTSDRVYYAPENQEHIWERRIIGNNSDPADVARWQREALFNPKSKAYQGKDRYPEVTEMMHVDGKKSYRAYITNGEKGTKVTSVRKQSIKKGTR